jgi:succinate dehydrogenase flavin-adding protein (antitoxin of CptAB toxin-antitoxin module)
MLDQDKLNYLELNIYIYISKMNFNIVDLSPDEMEFYNRKIAVSQEEISKHINNGKSFDDVVVTEACNSIVSYYNWIKENVKDEDKYKIIELDDLYKTNYTGNDLKKYEKELYDTLPNIGKWQVENYDIMWRGLQEADECLKDFIYYELDYLCNVL